MAPTSVLFIDIQETSSNTIFKRARKQPFYWVAKNSGNGRVMAISSERYTNRQDCVDAARLIFGSEVNVYLRQENQPNQLLRYATNDQPTQ